MNRPVTLLMVASLLASSSALAASDAPQSYIDAVPPTKTDAHVVEVQILAIDGQPPKVMPVAVYPGGHWITAALISHVPGRRAVPKDFALKVEPCTYYYLAARTDPAFSGSWKPIVNGEETMTSCNPAEELRKARAHAAQTPAPTPSPAKPSGH